jgi:amino acid transporter
MDDTQTSSSERNPVTQVVHRRQVLWQITLPLVILAVIFLALTVLISLSGAGYQSRWADVSLIWCLCPNLIVLLLCVGTLGGMAYGLFLLQRVLPGKLFSLQKFSLKVRDGVQKVSDAVVEPVLKVHSSRAGQKTLLKNIRDLFNRRPRDEE